MSSTRLLLPRLFSIEVCFEFMREFFYRPVYSRSSSSNLALLEHMADYTMRISFSQDLQLFFTN